MAFNPGNTDSSSPVRGLPKGSDGNSSLRLELRTFAKNKDLFDLYLLGLWAWQKVPQDQDLSWFQICGIHGLPYTKWPQNDPNLDKIKAANTGFCTHTSILFLTWHRPYLALFESTLYQAMKYVAEQATEEEGRGRYLKALESFRMPYWDWALPVTNETPAFPSEAIDSDKVKLPVPEKMREVYDLKSQDTLVELDNPLYCYRFADGTPENFLVDKKPTTQRYSTTPEPTSEQRKKNLLKYLHPYSQEWRETLGTTPVERNLRERVVYLLQSYTNFAHVSNNEWAEDQQAKIVIRPNDTAPKTPGMGFGSIEDVHNAMHVITGGVGNFRGHMKQVPKSAFDPIFWLHHTNIDRIFTIWQALNDNPTDKDSFVTDRPGKGTWVTAPGDTEDAATLLAPFYESEDKFWDSDGVRSADTFGYAYPETQFWKFQTPEEYRADILAQLQTLYPNGSLGNTIKSLRAKRTDAIQLEATMKKRAATLATVINTKSVPNDTATLLSVVHQSAASTSGAFADTSQAVLAALPSEAIPLPIYEVPSDLTLTALASNDTYLEWLVNVKAEKHVMNGQYSVHVFLDNVEETYTNLFPVTPNHVGTFYPFGQSADTGCGRCKVGQANHAEISGQIPLTVALAERYFAGLLRSLEPAEVVPYLQQNLHWRVLDANGQIVEDRSQVAGLLVGVISNEVTLPAGDNEFPQYSPDITHYPQITTNRDGEGRGSGTGVTRNNFFFAVDQAA